MLCVGLAGFYRAGFVSAFRKIGRLGIFGATAFGLSLVFLTMALHTSPVADVMFTLAAIPILTALMAWVTLRERITILVLWGGLISPIYYSLFVVASRHIRAGELMLVVPLETILAVLLAWLVLTEIPGTNTLLGGILIIIAVSGMAIYRMYEQPKGGTA